MLSLPLPMVSWPSMTTIAERSASYWVTRPFVKGPTARHAFVWAARCGVMSSSCSLTGGDFVEPTKRWIASRSTLKAKTPDQTHETPGREPRGFKWAMVLLERRRGFNKVQQRAFGGMQHLAFERENMADATSAASEMHFNVDLKRVWIVRHGSLPILRHQLAFRLRRSEEQPAFGQGNLEVTLLAVLIASLTRAISGRSIRPKRILDKPKDPDRQGRPLRLGFQKRRSLQDLRCFSKGSFCQSRS